MKRPGWFYKLIMSKNLERDGWRGRADQWQQAARVLTRWGGGRVLRSHGPGSERGLREQWESERWCSRGEWEKNQVKSSNQPDPRLGWIADVALTTILARKGYQPEPRSQGWGRMGARIGGDGEEGSCRIPCHRFYTSMLSMSFHFFICFNSMSQVSILLLISLFH